VAVSVDSFEPWIVRAARLHPDRVAVEAPDGRFTNAELEQASWYAADFLIANGAIPGDDIALVLPPGAAFAAFLHGCLRAGLVAVPIDGRLPPEQRASRQAGAVVVVDEEIVEGLGLLSIEEPPDELEHGGWMAYSPGGERRTRWELPGEHAPRPIAGSGTDAATPAVRLTTSGTTGPGTPVHLSRGALLWNALGSAAALGQPAGERWLSAMPVAHVGGLTVLIRSAIAATAAVLRPRFDLDDQLATLQAGGATITSVVPTTLSRLLDAGLDHPRNLRLVLLGGAPIPPELLARAEAAGVPVAATYGLSEASSQVLTRGWPLFCTRVALRSELGAESKPAAESEPRRGSEPGAPGSDTASFAPDELLVQGPTLARGVAGPDGWLATGDRGRRNPDGSFGVIGRLAETIVTGGENVAPTEVESQLVALPGIADAAVLGIEDPEWGERVEARVVLAAGSELDEPALIAALRKALPSYAVPKRITVVEQLPRTPTGKLLRRELQ
jgi:O-succinylbenzoic acid--CoA ligase